MSIDRKISTARKLKWVEKQFYGYFKRQIEIAHVDMTQVSSTWRVSGELNISQFSVVCHLYKFGSSIKSCRIVSRVTKILQTFLPIRVFTHIWRKMDGFMPFLRSVEWSETQPASFRIWTRFQFLTITLSTPHSNPKISVTFSYISASIYIYIYIYLQTPTLARVECDTKSIFKQSLTGLNSGVFLYLRAVAKTRLKSSVCSIIYPYLEGE